MSILSLKLSKDEFKFSAAHFLIFDSHRAERLHGHNYQVEFEVFFKDDKIEKDINSNNGRLGYFIDFKELKTLLRLELQKLDEYVLIPKNHPDIQVKMGPKSLEIQFRERYYAFPTNEVVLLPVINTSVEELSKYLLTEVSKGLTSYSFTSMKLSVAETTGQAASCEFLFKDS